jgi:AcrR family transcriptional regulator
MTARAMRSDARLKREAIIAAAAQLFDEQGVDVPLDEVARRADVGIATLYRRFPTREELITGVYLREVDLLCDGVGELLAAMPADRALITWMQRFISSVGAKRGMCLAVKSIVMTSGPQALESCHDRIHRAINQLIDAGERTGVLRTGVDSEDLVLAMAAFCQVTDRPGWHERADRLVLLTINGLRPDARDLRGGRLGLIVDSQDSSALI